MLARASKQCNESMCEVDVALTESRYQLIDPSLLRKLMQRTGDGSNVTIRDLAAAVGVPHGTVGNLLTGEQASVSQEIAQRIADRIGVDLLVLWRPAVRRGAVRAVRESA
jgi:transcriptional regulator with XRE-family HTH domain